MITIYCVGKMKESFYREAAAEYAKRIGRYEKLRIIEVPDEKIPERAGGAETERVKRREGERLLKQIKKDTCLIALEIRGKRMDSAGFAETLGRLRTTGRGNIGFVIGGSLGLSDEVLARADIRLSFSDFTFPHQLMRVILLEQIYRAEKILANETYHK